MGRHETQVIRSWQLSIFLLFQKMSFCLKYQISKMPRWIPRSLFQTLVQGEQIKKNLKKHETFLPSVLSKQSLRRKLNHKS